MMFTDYRKNMNKLGESEMERNTLKEEYSCEKGTRITEKIVKQT